MPSFAFTTNLPLPRTPQELQDRIRELFFIRTELEREIETLMGVKAEAAKTYHCVRCDYRWKSRLAHRPKMCPSCRIKKFDSPPLYTYEEKIARKKEMLARAQAVREAQTAPKEPPPVVIPPVTIPPPMPHSVITRQVSSESDSIQNITLAPPPVPMMNSGPLSLRERLERMKSQPVPQPAMPESAPAPEPETILSEDELVEAINNGDNDAV